MIAIRRARDSDVGAIESCARAAYQKYVERIGREPAPMVADFSPLICADQVLIATLDKQLAGFAVGYAKDREFHLENIAVSPDHQAKGVGLKLIDAMHSRAVNSGFDTITLYTNEMMTENFDWYIRLGYIETGRRSENGFNRVYFRKALA